MVAPESSHSTSFPVDQRLPVDRVVAKVDHVLGVGTEGMACSAVWLRVCWHPYQALDESCAMASTEAFSLFFVVSFWFHLPAISNMLFFRMTQPGRQRGNPPNGHPKAVAGWWLTYPTPLKNDGQLVSWDDDIPNIWKNKTCSKPPTRQKPLR